MKAYTPKTSKGRTVGGHDVHHKTADQPRSAAKKAAKRMKHAARQEGAKEVRRARKRAPSYEDVTLEELGSRYQRMYQLDLQEDMQKRTADNHFQLALLYLATSRFKVVDAGRLYRVPNWSDFSARELAEREGNLKATQP